MNRNDSTFPTVKEDNYCISVVILQSLQKVHCFNQVQTVSPVLQTLHGSYDMILESEVRSSAATIIRKLEKPPEPV